MKKNNPTLVDSIKGFVTVVNSTKQLIREINTPLPEKARIITFEDLKLDQATGRCWYKEKEYRFRKDCLSYMIINLLMERPGRPVSYSEFFQAIRLSRGDGTQITKNMVSSSIRELRRKFGINSNSNEDLFIATGDGFRLIAH